MENYNILYIHGLRGTKNGSKVTALRNRYGAHNEVVCIEWDQADDFNQVIREQLEKLDKTRKTFLLGSSSGGKILFLTLELMKDLGFNYEPFCILLNPLTKVKYINEEVNNTIYNSYLLSDAIAFKSLQNATIIYSIEDEIIDQVASIKEYDSLNTFKQVHDHHGLHSSTAVIFESMEDYTKK